MSSEPILHEDVKDQLISYSHCKLPECTLPGLWRHIYLLWGYYPRKIRLTVNNLQEHASKSL